MVISECNKKKTKDEYWLVLKNDTTAPEGELYHLNEPMLIHHGYKSAIFC